jgi:two-component system chemotaxis sensor kinase CheA
MDDILRDFLSEANESIEQLDRALVRFEREPEDPALLSEIFRVMHTIKGTCGFLGLPRLAAVAHAGENILGEFREGGLKPTQDSVSAVLDCVDVIKALLAHLEAAGEEPPGDDKPIITRLNAIANAKGAAPPAAADPAEAPETLAARIGGISSVDCAIEMALAAARGKPEGIRLHGVEEEALHAGVRDAAWRAIAGEPGPDLSAALAALGVGGAEETTLVVGCIERALNDLGTEAAAVSEAITLIRGAPPPAPAAEHASLAPAAAGGSAVAAQTIRVQVQSLEQLMNVASELVLIRNQLLQTLRSQPDSPFAGPLQRLNHVTTELQESVMTTRMQPIGAAWAKLPRLARDLALELGKRIEIQMRGEETELDRQVMEQIKDPLTHMIRNSADHGLETPGERARAGKPEVGRIHLSARHEGSHIVIEVGDDGKGLAVSKIRAKALSQGLITPAEAESLSDARIQQLIFHPGFSTASSVTGVSGRGVGMDVVKTNIEKIGGTVELASVEGKGASFTIRIPLTLTIVSALIVDCRGERFALPQSSVVELVGVGGGSGRAIEAINGTPVLRLRDRLLPLVCLQELMRLDAASTTDERSILVTRVGAFTFGIIVDRVYDTEEIVVKPAASVFRSIPFYSGATILGDGAVIMILDPKGIASRIGSIDIGEQDDGQKNHASEPLTQLLVVRGAGPTLKATPLQQVSRIETVDGASVEYANGRPVLQYRGRLMPLVALDDGEVATPGRSRPVLVFDDDTRAIGLVVEEVIDVVESNLHQEFKPHGPGTLGSLVVGEHVTDIIDLAYYWRLAAVEAAPADQDYGGFRKRALVIDPSQFQRNLVAPLLSMAGFDVTMADYPATAKALIERGPPFDIILTDAWISERDLPQAGGAPVIGLFDDATAAGGRADRFAETASRFDRDGLIAAIETALRPSRNAA